MRDFLSCGTGSNPVGDTKKTFILENSEYVGFGFSGYTAVYMSDEPLTDCTFGDAIEALKNGKRVAREGWNGKGMFLFLLPEGEVPVKAIHDPELRKVIAEHVGGDTFQALGSIRMLTADKKILTGWLASQTDILSDDWIIFP